jgi:hypothetical protein
MAQTCSNADGQRRSARFTGVEVGGKAPLKITECAGVALMSSSVPSPNGLLTPLVSNSSVPIVGSSVTRLGLYVFNPSAAVVLWVSPTGIPAAVGGPASIAIQPQSGMLFGPPTMPSWTNGMNAIASSAGSNVIVLLEFYS